MKSHPRNLPVYTAAQSWTSPKTARNKPSQIAGSGFFAIAPINKGEIVAVKAGHVIDKLTLKQFDGIIQDSEMQISDTLYLAPLTDEELQLSMIYMNHSCEPNCGVAGTNMFVSMRDIKADEELTFDYAMHRSEPEYHITCNCQTASCRQTIGGNDWKLPELQQRYAGYFSWYIEQKIKAQHTC